MALGESLGDELGERAWESIRWKPDALAGEITEKH